MSGGAARSPSEPQLELLELEGWEWERGLRGGHGHPQPIALSLGSTEGLQVFSSMALPCPTALSCHPGLGSRAGFHGAQLEKGGHSWSTTGHSWSAVGHSCRTTGHSWSSVGHSWSSMGLTGGAGALPKGRVGSTRLCTGAFCPGGCTVSPFLFAAF